MKVTEAETLRMVNTKLKSKVSTPEAFAWTEDGGHIFIYILSSKAGISYGSDVVL